MRIVATPLGDLDDHVVGPILRTGLPTIGDYKTDSAFAHHVGPYGFFVAVEVAVHLVLNKARVQLIDFEAGRFFRRWMIRNAQQREADA